MGTLRAAAVAVALMIFASSAVAQSGVDEYSPFVPSADGERPGGKGAADNGGGSAPAGGSGTSGAGAGGSSPEFEALRERLTRSGALGAPGFSNLLRSFRGLEGDSPPAVIQGAGSDEAAARPAASSTDSGGDRTGLLLIVLAVSTIAATGLGVAFKRRRDGLAVRH